MQGIKAKKFPETNGSGAQFRERCFSAQAACTGVTLFPAIRTSNIRDSHTIFNRRIFSTRSQRRVIRSNLKGTDVPTGILKMFKADKGFGFIKPDDGGPDVFVHMSAAEQSGLHQLQAGMRLGFDVEADRKTGKPRAANLRLL
jgi:cold shock protein